MEEEKYFRPLSGNLLSLRCIQLYRNDFWLNFRPLSGNLLSLRSIGNTGRKEDNMRIFVPYRGIYFLYAFDIETTTLEKLEFSSPIGESTFSTLIIQLLQMAIFGFSSPIGESTFSTGHLHCLCTHYTKFSSPIGESTFSTLPLEPLCLSGFRSCFAGQNLKIVFLFLFLMLAPLFPLFYAVRRKILFTAGKTLFFPFPYHIIFLDISCICIHAVQLQGLRPLHVYAVHTL